MEAPGGYRPEVQLKNSSIADRAKEKATTFIQSTKINGSAPIDRLREVQAYTALRTFPFDLGNGRMVDVPYMTSLNDQEAQGKPTVVMFPGIFQQVKQLPTDLATVAHTFGVRVIAFDYASFAQKRGIEDIMRGLPQLLEHVEGNQTPPPPRIFIGESLGGLTAQTLAFQAERDAALAERLNIQQLVLSHTIPPQRISPRLQRAVTFFDRHGRHIPFPIGRAGVEVFGAVGRAVVGVRSRVFGKDQGASELDRELAIMQDIIRGEKDALTYERAMGYIATSATLLNMRREDDRTHIPTTAVLSSEDKIFKPIPQSEWQKHFSNIAITMLNGTPGHAAPEKQKHKVLIESIIPALAQALPVAR